MREPTDEMILAGAKAIIDQLDEKGDVWDREGLVSDQYKRLLLKAAKYAWLAMAELEVSQ